MVDPVQAGRALARTASGSADEVAARIVADSRAGGSVDVDRVAASLADLARSDPAATGAVRAQVDAQLSPVDRGALAARSDAPAPRAGPDPRTLALDVGQIALDIAGIFDPTPVSDGTNAVISLFRGDLVGAGLSAVSIIPYVGDAAKLGKLGKWAETVASAVELAAKNPAFARSIEPVLRRISDAIDAAPLDKLPDGARRQLEGIRDGITGQLAAGERAAAAAARTGIPEDTVREVVAAGKGNRPDPTTYMSRADIDAHLQAFRDSGAVRFTTRESVTTHGTLGPPGGTFTIPRSELDRVIDETGGNFAQIEQRLGLTPGTLANGDTLIAFVKPENLNGLRMPSGNELGANSQWVPGGFTSGGVPEATIDVPAGTRYTEIKLQP